MQRSEPLFGSANQFDIGTCLEASSILKENQASGLDALGADAVHDGSYLYCTGALIITKLTNAFMTTGLDLGNTLQLVFAVLLLILGVLVAIQGIKKLLENMISKNNK